MKKIIIVGFILVLVCNINLSAQDSVKTRRIYLSGLSCSVGYYNLGKMDEQFDSLRHLLSFEQALVYDSFRIMQSSRAIEKSFSGNQVAFNLDLGIRTKDLQNTRHHIQISAIFTQNLSYSESFYAEHRIPNDTLIGVNTGEIIYADSFRQTYQNFTHSFYLWRFNFAWLYEIKLQKQISLLAGPSFGFGFTGKRSISGKHDEVLSNSYFEPSGLYLASDTGEQVTSAISSNELKNFSFITPGIPVQLSIGIGKPNAPFYNVNLFAEAFVGYALFFTPDFEKRNSPVCSISFGLQMRPSPIIMKSVTE